MTRVMRSVKYSETCQSTYRQRKRLSLSPLSTSLTQPARPSRVGCYVQVGIGHFGLTVLQAAIKMEGLKGRQERKIGTPPGGRCTPKPAAPEPTVAPSAFAISIDLSNAADDPQTPSPGTPPAQPTGTESRLIESKKSAFCPKPKPAVRGVSELGF